jgi:hypothetical protein
MAIRPGTDTKSELEQYGVWVKAEPQDIAEEGAVSEGAGLSGESPAVSEEAFLSEDEEKLLGSFDSEFEMEKDAETLPNLEDIPSLDEPVLASGFESSEAQTNSEASIPLDISLEESDNAGRSSAIHPGVEIDMSSVEGLGDPNGSKKQSSSSIEDVSSEFLDISEVSEPSETPSAPASPDSSQFVSGMDDVTAEFLDIEESISAPKAAVDSSSDFESLDIDLHFDDTVSQPSAPASSSAAEAGFEAVTEFDDFLGAESAPEKPGSAGGDFDDVSAVERELASPASAAPAAAPARATAPSGAAKADMSTEILLKIADELSSIRGELVNLRSKIGEVTMTGEASVARNAEPSSEAQDESVSTGGFFDDEEDETIALTGDELDNILNTADFTTEEPTEAEQPLGIEDEALAEAPSLADVDLLDESLLPESGDYAAAPEIEPAIEEVRLGEADSIDSVVAQKDDLDLVAEEGVVPLTNAPEDTSYLESPEGFDLGEVGIPEDKPLVEPDISDLDLAVEELEPRAEVEEELPLAAPEAGGAEIGDMTLGIEAGPSFVEEAPAEAEFLEAIPEIDEPDFSEINLHEENVAAAEPVELEEISSLDEAALVPEISEEEEDLMLSAVEEPSIPSAASAAAQPADDGSDRLKSEIKSVLSYLDKLLDSLPEEKIEEFAKSKYFDTYKKLFEELGLV